ncbi:MAG: hypothetical protein ACAI43_06260 [Phycisphaerae bacterium]|nr:hypothetical protein [Tepidisphaeraceae bacterium]
MSAHPGDFIDRVPPIAVRGAASYPLVLTVDGSEVSLRVVFKYAADESTIFIEELLIDED